MDLSALCLLGDSINLKIKYVYYNYICQCIKNKIKFGMESEKYNKELNEIETEIDYVLTLLSSGKRVTLKDVVDRVDPKIVEELKFVLTEYVNWCGCNGDDEGDDDKPYVYDKDAVALSFGAILKIAQRQKIVVMFKKCGAMDTFDYMVDIHTPKSYRHIVINDLLEIKKQCVERSVCPVCMK
ncbi:orf115 [Artaxa digramma nucleopolyhedrovirus]|uniref:Orf115 n=1 Tax=Artaxa digramma nucleopolyhedrovirus TaxID=3070910 RepID=A0AAE6V0I7_9ABAC|nr:orf115 [Euproctis digramma nucleopolyhedrovirus]QHB21774.1 orf115 [Artaxa digramma nucleopolyhedrovirus]